MKGIRKLFLGLFLMTLIGVGFKVDAKAADNEAISIARGPEVTSDWNTEGACLRGFIEIPADSLPGSGETTTYTCILVGKDGTSYYDIGSAVTIKVNNTGDSYKYGYGTAEPTITYTAGERISFYTSTTDLGKETIRSAIASHYDPLSNGTPETITTEVYAKVTKGAGDPKYSAKIDVTMGRVFGGVYKGYSSTTGGTYSNSIRDEEGNEVTSQKPLYLFSGEKLKFIHTGTPSGYKYIKWIATDSNTDYGTAAQISDGTEGSAYFTMPAAVNKYWIKERYGNLTIGSLSGNAGASVSATYTFDGYENGNSDVATTNGVLLDGTVIASPWDTAGNKTGTITFTIPAGTEEGPHTLKVNMKTDAGGKYYEFPVNVDNGTPVVLNDVVYVTEGLTAPLSRQVKSGTDSKNVRASIGGTTVASIDPTTASTTGTVLTSVSIKGVSATTDTAATTGVGTLTLKNATGTETYGTSKITVYPKPEITVIKSGGSSLTSSTSSSSTSTYALRVNMPIGDYHGTYTWSDIGNAKLIFYKSGNKFYEDTIETSSTDSSNKLIKYANINSMGLASVLRDHIDDDERSITVRAYPYKNGSYDSEVYGERSFSAYKIKLDRSAGASYTVNGQNVNDYFYGVDGVTYTIKSSGTGGLDRNNSGEFNSGETIQYQVLGARTLKAVYGSSSSSSSSSSSGRNAATAGEGMDDYDDVPKTGESKADIWILWSVLFISILGAGFMIWKRFGLVRAIAEADEQVAVAEHKEEVKAKKKEKEDKIKMLKDLRNL